MVICKKKGNFQMEMLPIRIYPVVYVWTLGPEFKHSLYFLHSEKQNQRKHLCLTAAVPLQQRHLAI